MLSVHDRRVTFVCTSQAKVGGDCTPIFCHKRVTACVYRFVGRRLATKTVTSSVEKSVRQEIFMPR